MIDTYKGYISIYNIFRQPKDYPDNIVVREQRAYPNWVETQSKVELFRLDELDKARFMLRDRGCIYLIPRDKSDVPSLVESWSNVNLVQYAIYLSRMQDKMGKI